MTLTLTFDSFVADSLAYCCATLYKQQSNQSNLQVVGQFRSSSITRIHCYTDVTHWIQNQLGAFKFKYLQVCLHCTNYAKNLHIQNNMLQTHYTIQLKHTRPNVILHFKKVISLLSQVISCQWATAQNITTGAQQLRRWSTRTKSML